ncbi:hypothetical protein ACGFSB_15425 [Streptomyces sp. NPDC048441]|uniref:hypothetical protein n=1 Tax=Streptomyces sp. NPDC048441 TaxID=3365552 RepID=UPI00372071C0
MGYGTAGSANRQQLPGVASPRTSPPDVRNRGTSPDELLRTGGVYAELYALQADQFTAKIPWSPASPNGHAER